MLYARYQNLPAVRLTDNQEAIARAWEGWAAIHTVEWVEFVKKAQYNLFDQVNGLL